MEGEVKPDGSGLVAPVKSDMQLFKGFKSVTPFIPGRREFFKYRDLGVKMASKGRARANKSDSIASMVEPTGWHYHLCDFQFVYWLSGKIILEFEDGTVATFVAGESVFIPGGFRHNEIYVSEDKQSIEFSMPGEIGTVNIERPDHLPAVLRPVDSANPG
jgi:mannose-6-phosphate isomerase-like protein (cupin superfamily)